jgi:acetyl esterase
MSLDPDAERVLAMIAAARRPPIQLLQPHEAREGYRLSRNALTPDPPDVAHVEALTAAGPGGPIPLRVYRGLGTSGKLPGLVFMHGGGFCIGDLDTHDYVCRKLANSAQCAVISVAYRLAPEHKFPAAVEDGVAAATWVGKHAEMFGLDPARLAVGGDSAGGNLSAVLAHMARDGDLPRICFQMLLYPSLEMSMRHPSYRQPDFARLPLNLEAVRWFHGHYLQDAHDMADPRASPLRARSFQGLAPAFILTAGYDPLRDEGAEYARLLEQNNVPTTFVHMSDQMHGFLTMGRVIRSADTALEITATALKRAFWTSSGLS